MLHRVREIPRGAWIVIALIIIHVLVFRSVHRHYVDVAAQLKLPDTSEPETPLHNTVIVLVPGLHRGILAALRYARSLSPDCRAVYIETDPLKTESLKARWELWSGEIPLVILKSTFRSLISPIMQYLDAVQTERRNHLVTIIVPEFVPTTWWQTLLHGNSGLLLKFALLSRDNVVVANVRYYLHRNDGPPSLDDLAEET